MNKVRNWVTDAIFLIKVTVEAVFRFGWCMITEIATVDVITLMKLQATDCALKISGPSA